MASCAEWVGQREQWVSGCPRWPRTSSISFRKATKVVRRYSPISTVALRTCGPGCRVPLPHSWLEINAYTKSWALYTEQLAKELGVYSDKPEEQKGYLQSIAFRACRLVVD